MNAIVSMRTNASRTLDAKPTPDEVVRPDAIKDPLDLAQMLTRMLASISELRRRYVARRITYIEIDSTGTDSVPYKVRLPHGFGSAVEWTVVSVKTTGLLTLPFVEEGDGTDSDTLELLVYFPATLAVRVEERP